MLEYKGVKYSLNDTPNFKDKRLSGRLFSYAIGKEEYLKPLKAKDFKSAKLEVERIIIKRCIEYQKIRVEGIDLER